MVHKEIYIELQDTQWQFDYIDHDRNIARAIVYDENGIFYFVRAERDDDFGKATLIETAGGGVEVGEELQTAIQRELKEELGVEAEEKDLQYIATIKSTKNPKNMEFAYVYLLRCNKKIEEYTFEDDEVSEVKYVLYKDLEKMVEEKAEGLLIHKEEFEKLFQYIRSL